MKASDQKVCSGINVVKMRYPHVLLMYAEVMNELYGSYNTGGEYCSKQLSKLFPRYIHVPSTVTRLLQRLI